MKSSMRMSFCYRLSLERIRRARYLTIYNFHQVHLESVKNVMLSQGKMFDRHFLLELCFSSVSIKYKLFLKTMSKAQQDAGRWWRDSTNKESRFIIHQKLTNPIPRTEASLNVKLARKLPHKKWAKKQLAGLYEVLKPGHSSLNLCQQQQWPTSPDDHQLNWEIATLRISGLKKRGQQTCGLKHNVDQPHWNKLQRPNCET